MALRLKNLVVRYILSPMYAVGLLHACFALMLVGFVSCCALVCVIRLADADVDAAEYDDEFDGEAVEPAAAAAPPENRSDFRRLIDPDGARGYDARRAVGIDASRAGLLTLFTTMKDGYPRLIIHNNVVVNWAALQPYVKPVLFVENSTSELLVSYAARLGWQILNVTRWNRGIPILKYMFLDVMERYSSAFYGYANADILFDRTLVANLEAFAGYRQAMKSLFVVGRRRNLNTTSAYFRRMDASNLTLISELGRRSSTVFVSDAQDYFITTPGGFPWRRIPELVIGRVGYDNWLVVLAQRWNFVVVDASYTLLAVHQTGYDGNLSGWTETVSRCINRDIIGVFNFGKGQSRCARYMSYADFAGEIRILRRPKTSRDCHKSLARYVKETYVKCF